MERKTLHPEAEKQLLKAQKNEITEHFIYEKLSATAKESKNKSTLKKIAEEELKHHDICVNFTCQSVHPNRLKVWMYYLVSVIFGITFSLKLMERAEKRDHITAYAGLSGEMPQFLGITKDEIRHEKQLMELIDDERLNYSSDIVRGMNVAIVEITGTLAGLTFAFEDSAIVVETAIIVGTIMSLSVMSTEYLAARAAPHIESPIKSLLYAGAANLLTIFVLLLPYLLLSNIYAALAVTIAAALVIIFIFAFYISVVKDLSIKKRFFEMALVSLGIAALAFGIGLLARSVLHIEVV